MRGKVSNVKSLQDKELGIRGATKRGNRDQNKS